MFWQLSSDTTMYMVSALERTNDAEDFVSKYSGAVDTDFVRALCEQVTGVYKIVYWAHSLNTNVSAQTKAILQYLMTQIAEHDPNVFFGIVPREQRTTFSVPVEVVITDQMASVLQVLVTSCPDMFTCLLDDDNCTALHILARVSGISIGIREMVRKAVECSQLVVRVDTRGNTFLHAHAQNSKPTYTDCIFFARLQVNAYLVDTANIDGMTPLVMAFNHGWDAPLLCPMIMWNPMRVPSNALRIAYSCQPGSLEYWRFRRLTSLLNAAQIISTSNRLVNSNSTYHEPHSTSDKPPYGFELTFGRIDPHDDTYHHVTSDKCDVMFPYKKIIKQEPNRMFFCSFYVDTSTPGSVPYYLQVSAEHMGQPVNVRFYVHRFLLAKDALDVQCTDMVCTLENVTEYTPDNNTSVTPPKDGTVTYDNSHQASLVYDTLVRELDNGDFIEVAPQPEGFHICPRMWQYGLPNNKLILELEIVFDANPPPGVSLIECNRSIVSAVLAKVPGQNYTG